MPIGEIIYDVNDLMKGYLGSYLYDVIRMAVSVSTVCEGSGIRSGTESPPMSTIT